jgi:hypothetical protein
MDEQMRTVIVNQIVAERNRQLEQCFIPGIDCNTFDKGNSINDWVAYITAYAGRVTSCRRNTNTQQVPRDNLIKAAALCIAAIEAIDSGWC